MITINDAIRHVADNGMSLSSISKPDAPNNKRLLVARKDRSDGVVIEHVGGKMWVIEGQHKRTQAHCIINAVIMLLNGDPVR